MQYLRHLLTVRASQVFASLAFHLTTGSAWNLGAVKCWDNSEGSFACIAHRIVQVSFTKCVGEQLLALLHKILCPGTNTWVSIVK